MKRLIIALIAGFAIAAPAAFAASHFVKVSPGAVKRGNKVTVSGNVGGGCQVGHKGDVATIISNAFKGSTKTKFAGVPAVQAALNKKGKFSFTIKIRAKRGSYDVSGRCGGGIFGGTSLKVT